MNGIIRFATLVLESELSPDNHRYRLLAPRRVGQGERLETDQTPRSPERPRLPEAPQRHSQALNTRTVRLLSVPVESQPRLSSDPGAKRGGNSACPGAERSPREHVTARSRDAVGVGLYESNSAFTCALIWGRAAPREIVTLNVGILCFRGCLQPICITCEVHDELS
jgi:hypothetical protein